MPDLARVRECPELQEALERVPEEELGDPGIAEAAMKTVQWWLERDAEEKPRRRRDRGPIPPY